MAIRVIKPPAVAALYLILAACSGAPQLTPGPQVPLQSRSLNNAGAQPLAPSSSPLLFASTGRGELVEIYNELAPHKLIGQISTGLKGPNAMAVDTKGDLWVVNIDGLNVAEYPPGATQPSMTITKDLTNPLTVAIGNDGTVYISNLNPITGASQVLEYPAGQLNPSFTIRLVGAPIGLAVDAKNDVYVTTENFNTGASIVMKFPPKSTRGINLGIKLLYAGRMAVDSKNNLIVCDQLAPAVYVFPPGSNKPSGKITSGFRDPFGVALNHDATRLYVADSAGNINIYLYPGLKLVSKIVRTTATLGVAVNPPAPI